MYIEQLYTNCLAEAAYYVESGNEAVIIDPLREVDQYIKMAEERGAEIKYIFETHFHADFVSGHVDLAKKTGATIVFGPNASTSYEAHIANDGETFKFGEVEIKVLHTPGHTLESSVYLLQDEAGIDHAIFTGDTLFIGDVGRPDLAIKSDLTKEDLAGMLYDSLRKKILPLSDNVVVYPAHGAGSACGKNMSSDTYASLGSQKETNYALQDMTKEDFITQLLDGIAPPPQYFAKNAAMNKMGYETIDSVIQNGKRELSVVEAKEYIQQGALVLDTRTEDDFRLGHIKNAVFIGLNGNFATWVGALIPDIQQQIVLITPEGKEEEAVIRLARVGYDNAVGVLKGGVETWVNDGEMLESIEQVCSSQVEIDNVTDGEIVDVRKPGEFEGGHVVNALNVPLDYIHQEHKQLDQNKKYYVHCKAGYRSMVAISLLKRKGYQHLVDVKGGYDAILGQNSCSTENTCSSS